MSDYNSDLEVRDASHDEFQRYPFSQRIAQTILDSTSADGIVIGIYGAWGEGKSSILEFIATEIEPAKRIM
jgi:predicted KAP-like P-loop ATPase